MTSKARRFTALNFAAALLIAQTAGANGPPIQSETAFLAGLHGAGMRTFFKETRKSKLLRDGSKISDPNNRDLRVRAIPIVLPYEALPNRLVVGLAVPLLDKRMDLNQNGTPKRLTNTGAGDISLFGKFRMFQRDQRADTTRAAGKISVKLPTGKTNATDDAGALMPLPLQLGTGATDVSFGGILMHLRRRWGVNGGARYTVKTRGNGARFGDVVNYDLAFSYRAWPVVYETFPSPQWNFMMEFNGGWEQKRRAGGASVADSGGHALFWSPGLQYMGGRSWLLEFSYQIPVIQDLNGTQLGTDHTLLLGLRWLLG